MGWGKIILIIILAFQKELSELKTWKVIGHTSSAPPNCSLLAWTWCTGLQISIALQLQPEQREAWSCWRCQQHMNLCRWRSMSSPKSFSYKEMATITFPTTFSILHFIDWRNWIDWKYCSNNFVHRYKSSLLVSYFFVTLQQFYHS